MYQGGEMPINRLNSASHDAFTRLLQRQPPDTEALGNEVYREGNVSFFHGISPFWKTCFFWENF